MTRLSMSDAQVFPHSAPARMKPPGDLAIAFSAFIEFVDGRLSRWVIDPRLRKNMEARLQQTNACLQNEVSEAFWVLYWLRCWQQQRDGLAIAHLTAYLQEPCYWAAHKMSAQQGSLSDYFQIAIAEVTRILTKYDPQQPTGLKSYASQSFSNIIRDVRRQRGEADSRSDWGLLRKVSQKRLEEVLQAAGDGPMAIVQYSLAWNCFKTLWAPTEKMGTRQLAEPGVDTWRAIADLYNRRRSQQGNSGPAGTPELLERWLKECASKIRAYLYPQTTSLNVCRYEMGEEMQVDLPDLERPSPLMALITQEEMQERQSQRQQINGVLSSALSQFDQSMQELLVLYYQQGLTQAQIGEQLSIKQYAVSRKLSSAKANLLSVLSQWSQETLHMPLVSPVVDHLNTALEEWLRMQYQPTNQFPQE